MTGMDTKVLATQLLHSILAFLLLFTVHCWKHFLVVRTYIHTYIHPGVHIPYLVQSIYSCEPPQTLCGLYLWFMLLIMTYSNVLHSVCPPEVHSLVSWQNGGTSILISIKSFRMLVLRLAWRSVLITFSMRTSSPLHCPWKVDWRATCWGNTQ